MSGHASFEPEARAELLEALAWYSDKEPALGVRFLDEIDRAMADILDRPAAHARRLDVPDALNVRHRLLVRFPYSIVFMQVAGEVRVLAVAHQKRQPGYFRHRVPAAGRADHQT